MKPDPAFDEPLEFEFLPGEPIRARVVRFCRALVPPEGIGHNLHQARYKAFINCRMRPAGYVGETPVNDISPWTTSCAITVRAVDSACGKETLPAINASPVQRYIQCNETHPAWEPWKPGNPVRPGDRFYIHAPKNPNNNHVGIFLEEIAPGVWLTLEGGGSDGPGGADEGSLVKLGRRDLNNFDPYGRVLVAIMNCDKIELPASPPKLEPVVEPIRVMPSEAITRPDVPSVLPPPPAPVFDFNPPPPAPVFDFNPPPARPPVDWRPYAVAIAALLAGAIASLAGWLDGLFR